MPVGSLGGLNAPYAEGNTKIVIYGNSFSDITGSGVPSTAAGWGTTGLQAYPPCSTVLNNYIPTSFGVSGSGTLQLLEAGNLSTLAGLYDGAKANNILIFWELTNDATNWDTPTARTVVDRAWEMCDDRRAEGWIVVMVNAIPRWQATTRWGAASADYSNFLDDVNTLVASEWDAHANGFIDARAAFDAAESLPAYTEPNFSATGFYSAGDLPSYVHPIGFGSGGYTWFLPSVSDTLTDLDVIAPSGTGSMLRIGNGRFLKIGGRLFRT